MVRTRSVAHKAAPAPVVKVAPEMLSLALVTDPPACVALRLADLKDIERCLKDVVKDVENP